MNPFRKYTTCVKPGDYVNPPWSSAAVAAAWAIMLAVIVAPLLLLVPGYWAVLIPVDVFLIAVCQWYLDGRLICLGSLLTCPDNGNQVPLPDNQECAIGVVGAPGHSGIFRPRVTGLNLSKLGDDDSTMEILLAPGPTNYDADKHYYWNQVQGYLVAENSESLGIGLGYVQSHDIEYVKYLHCEFEGSGVHDLLELLSEILAFLIAMMLVQALVPGSTLVLWLLAIIAALLAAVGLGNLFGAVFDPGAPGDPTDIDPGLDDLQAGDIVAVSGDWIYDSGHDGWNEIHAVHNCQKIAKIQQIRNPDGTETWSWPPDVGGGWGFDTSDKVTAARNHWCCAMGAATIAIAGGSTTDPANNWVIHPLVDGCQKPVIIL